MAHVAAVLAVSGRRDPAARLAATSVAVQMVTGRLAAPVLLAHGVLGVGLRCPRPDEIRWHPAPDGIRLGWVGVEPAPIRCWVDVVTELTDASYRPFLAALRTTHRIPARLLWGNAAASLHYTAAAVARAGPATRTGLRELLDAIAVALGRALPGPPLVEVCDVRSDEISFVRRTCCLIDRAPGHHRCDECPLARSRSARLRPGR